MPALWYELGLGTRSSRPHTLGGIGFRDNAMPLYTCRAIPFFPIWPGLVITSIFWGAVAFIFVASLRAVRRDFRLRRDRCPSCAYDLNGAPGLSCPECGWNRPTFAESQTTP